MKQIPKVERKSKQKWITEDISDSMEKKGSKKKIIQKNTKYYVRKSEKNVMKPKKSGSITSGETSNYTTKV